MLGEESYTGADTTRVLVAITACQEAITNCQTTLTARIEEVKVDIFLVWQDFQKLRDRVKDTEDRISTVEDSLHPLQISSDNMQLQVNQLLQKQDDMENRLRRSNLRSIGLPEGVEGTDPSSFLEQLLCTTYGKEAFSPTFVVERAHRISAWSSLPHIHSKVPQLQRPRHHIATQQREGEYPIWQQDGRNVSRFLC